MAFIPVFHLKMWKLQSASTVKPAKMESQMTGEKSRHRRYNCMYFFRQNHKTIFVWGRIQLYIPFGWVLLHLVDVTFRIHWIYKRINSMSCLWDILCASWLCKMCIRQFRTRWRITTLPLVVFKHRAIAMCSWETQMNNQWYKSDECYHRMISFKILSTIQIYSVRFPNYSWSLMLCPRELPLHVCLTLSDLS